MKSVIMIFILIVSGHFCLAQNNIADIMFPKGSGAIESSSIRQASKDEMEEIKPKLDFDHADFDKEYIMPCLEYCLNNLDSLDLEGFRLLDKFRKYDFSGDGRADLVFSAYCSFEEQSNMIWINHDSTYEYSGRIWGTIVRLFRRHLLEPCTFLNQAGYCCAGYIGEYTFYEPAETSGNIHWKPSSDILKFATTPLPKATMDPVKFVVSQPKCRLRNSPEAIDSIGYRLNTPEEEQTHGNVLAEFEEGSIGVAYAEVTDSTGHSWWFVVMDEESLIGYNRFYQYFKSIESMKCGWMSARYLTVIE